MREEGYYWIKGPGRWYPAYFNGKHWVEHRDHYMSAPLDDRTIVRVGPRIQEPEEA